VRTAGHHPDPSIAGDSIAAQVQERHLRQRHYRAKLTCRPEGFVPLLLGFTRGPARHIFVDVAVIPGCSRPLRRCRPPPSRSPRLLATKPGGYIPFTPPGIIDPARGLGAPARPWNSSSVPSQDGAWQQDRLFCTSRASPSACCRTLNAPGDLCIHPDLSVRSRYSDHQKAISAARTNKAGFRERGKYRLLNSG
jgi:hypothetical protein